MAQQPQSRLSASSEAEVIFDSDVDGCGLWDVPDGPARAWRDHRGEVVLLAGNDVNRLFVGQDLSSLRRHCAVVHEGAQNDDPLAFDDRVWILATHTIDGRIVEAITHVEYHGHRRPQLCPGQDYLSCWRNALTALISHDGGRTFTRDPRGHVVAALPYGYSGRTRHRTGYFSPSNVLRVDDMLYVFMFAENAGEQRRGACLIRRPVEGGPADWRGYDGARFTVRFLDLRAETPTDPRDHVCAPIGPFDTALASIMRAPTLGGYVGVTTTTRRDENGVETSGVWWTFSQTLIDWSPPQLLLEGPLLWRRDCARPFVIAYPSLIDDDGPSRTFDVAEGDFWLFLTRIDLDSACRPTASRALVRHRISLR
jgi:hypothetical protein